MQRKNINFSFNELMVTELNAKDQELVSKSKEAIQLAYAPYSTFKVGAAAYLNNETIILGGNQENASYGATLCAERVLLANLLINHPNKHIVTLALSYKSQASNFAHPASPCGICRQVLLEHELLYQHPIRLILTGANNQVWLINSLADILPLAFSKENLL